MMHAQQKSAASEAVVLAFKRHILKESEAFASAPLADAFRVSLLAQMLDRYDELREKNMGEQSAMHRTMYEFADIPAQMQEMGFEEVGREEAAPSRWPQLGEEEAMYYIAERDAYIHKTALGILMCTACVTPIMIGAAMDAFWYSSAFAMLGLVGMFAMIGLGVYAIVTAMKPKGEKKIKKGRFSLTRGLRRRLEALRAETEGNVRRRNGKGVALIVTSVIPIVLGAALSELWWSEGWTILGVAGMFPMIGAGVYELVMADGEKKTISRLLKNKEE